MEATAAAAREKAAKLEAKPAAAEASEAAAASQPEAEPCDADADSDADAAHMATRPEDDPAEQDEAEPWNSWVFMHSPASPVTWKKTIARSPLSVTYLDQLTPPTPGRWKTNALMSMSHAELDAHFEEDFGLKLGLAAHRTEVRTRLGRTASSPSSFGSRSKPSTPSRDQTTPLPTISAWKLWGPPGKACIPHRDCLSDHCRAPTLTRKDPGGGPGEYCNKFMQKQVWSPLYGEFQSCGGPRTKCGVSSLSHTLRWPVRDGRDGLRSRMAGNSNLDMYTPLKSNFGP